MARGRTAFVVMFAAALSVSSVANASTVKPDGFKAAVLKRNYVKAAASLLAAAQSGDAKAQYRLAILYRLGIGVNKDDAQALHWLGLAAAQGNTDAAKLAATLQARTVPATDQPTPRMTATTTPVVDVAVRDKAGNTWLARAAARGANQPVIAMLAPEQPIARAGWTEALWAAARIGQAQSIKLLLATRTDAEGDGSDRAAALVFAAASQTPAAVQALLDGDVNLTILRGTGASALNVAAAHCDAAASVALLRHGATVAADSAGRTPLLRAAALCADTGAIGALAAPGDINAADSQGRTAIWYAASFGRANALTVLVRAGARCNMPDSEGQTPLHAAAAHAQAQVIAQLLACGANPDLLSSRGDTALMAAAAGGCSACVPPLLARTTLIDAKNAAGDTALLIAVRSGYGNIAAALLAAGADPELRNMRRDTAAAAALRSDDPQIRNLIAKR